jgi:hypothetical protein
MGGDGVRHHGIGGNRGDPAGIFAAARLPSLTKAADPAAMKNRAFGDPAVAEVFAAYPPELRPSLLALRALIFEVAEEQLGKGGLVETLKWAQPAYLPAKARTGTTVRIDAVKGDPGRYAAYFHCQTTLIDRFRELYPDEFAFEGNRALLFERDRKLPKPTLKHCLALALTYHARSSRL